MALAVAAFCGMDACLKTLSPHYAPLEIAAIRALASLPVVVAWAGLRGGYRQLLNVRWGLQLARAVAAMASLTLFTYGLRGLGLSETYAIFFVAPIMITALAVPLLGERVDAARWIAIAVGFGAVLVVLRPTGNGTFSVYGVAVLGSALGYALSNIAVRVLGRSDSTASIMFWNMLFLAVIAGTLSVSSWKPIQSQHWPIVAVMAVIGSIAQWALTEAFRMGEASVVAPFEYTALGWGLLLDWLLWDVLPAPVTLAGAGVVIVSGVYLVRRERAAQVVEHP